MNPLLTTTGLPLFDQIQPAHVQPAMDDLLAQAELGQKFSEIGRAHV